MNEMDIALICKALGDSNRLKIAKILSGREKCGCKLLEVFEITVLLCFLILLIGYIQSCFSPERSKKIVGRFHGIWANIIAALPGTVTPFCSSIPLFIGFTSAGPPLGVTFSFLISSPMVDLGSLLLLSSIFDGKSPLLM